MTRRAKIWRVIGALFTLVNGGGAAYAFAQGELGHAMVHVALLGATYVAWRLASRTGQLETVPMQVAENRLDRLQESLDAIALDVERVGEAQRYAAKVLAERARNAPTDQS